MKRTLAVFGLIACSAFAGPIALSGDVNIISNLLAQAGNQAFFNNLLGAGNEVVIRSGIIGGATLEGYYDSLAGVTATQVASVTAASLVGAELFVGLTSAVGYTPAEVAALTAFSAGGGTILLVGENQAFPAENAAVNALLAALGSGMSIGGVDFDYGFHDAVGAQILPHVLSAGVLSLNYAAPSNILGGTAIFLSENLQHAFIAAEGFAVIPEPSTVLLSVAGLLALAALRKRAG